MEFGLQLNMENWEPIYCANNVDYRHKPFTSTIVHMLNKLLPKCIVWMMPHIKEEIKAIQRAFRTGDKIKYLELCAKVAMLISKAKANYYQLKAEGIHKLNPVKWYKAVYEPADDDDRNRI